MRTLLWTLWISAAVPVVAQEEDWNPVRSEKRPKGLVDLGRVTEVYEHGTRKAWGYKAPQQDTFIVVHPKADRPNAPLYVVLHSAGHAVVSCVNCTVQVGNHDIYRSPDEFYALYLDCAANRGDWWWGGMPASDTELVKRNSGVDLRPVERRVIDTVQWVIQKYGIDPNRVYLCGNSMGGSGTLGIGMRHGDLFAAIKANVPAGIEHVSHRMGFPPQSVPETLKLPDPPVVVDYSAQNDGWSFGHERLVKSMNDRKYALYFYWGPFGHANNSAAILSTNDLVNSFDWLNVRRNEAYAVFTNASSNSALPWPDHLEDKTPGQVNAFFRWKTLADSPERLEMALSLCSSADLKTAFAIPKEATADVSLRRIQRFSVAPGAALSWTYGGTKGTVMADREGLITIPGLPIAPEATLLTLRR
ncbi:MAG TPA: prolyl oligopeptidase family serine peptidase [Planctomycetota bacterium]|nr:prolyl oligopeptidase family serine peptidase [Planctomycetota bacterium]